MVIASREETLESVSTKIFDVINERNCSDLANFNLRFFGTGLGANLYGDRIDTILQGIPVLCGSVLEFQIDTNIFTCYKFKQNGGWQEFVRMDGRRDYAAGIVYNNKFHVFGGWNNERNALRTSVIISRDGQVTDGPYLPEGELRRCVSASIVPTTTDIQRESFISKVRNFWVGQTNWAENS